MPADAVALGQRDGGRWPPRPRGIRPRRHALLGPGGADLVDPGPLRLDLVAADEQGRVALDEVEQQPLIGDPPAILAEGIGKPDIERDLAQPNALAVEPGSWTSAQSSMLSSGCSPMISLFGLVVAPREAKIECGTSRELDENLRVALRHALAGAQVEGHALPPPIVDMGLQRDEGLGRAVAADFLVVAGTGSPSIAPRVYCPVTLCASTSAAADRPKRAQHLYLLVAHRGRVEVGRRLHRDQREQLEHVVLDHVAQRAASS